MAATSGSSHQPDLEMGAAACVLGTTWRGSSMSARGARRGTSTSVVGALGVPSGALCVHGGGADRCWENTTCAALRAARHGRTPSGGGTRAEKKQEEKKEKPPKKPKSPQPKDEVGTRKKCRRYRWELKSNNKEFWVMGHGEVKFLGLGCLIAALILFNGLSAHPILTLIITMEVSILIFFIIIYSFAINRYMPFILWPIADLLNDLFAFCFLLGAVVFSVRSRPTLHLHYFTAVIFTGLAGLFALIDLCLQRKHFKGKRVKRNVLVPPPGKDKDKDKEKEGEAEKEKPKEAEAAPDKAKEEK
ncbi:CKLF-like MARVEL transmembrane domain-containing protein 2 [Orycteropus afer afer]|uniref:CKLF-like MARVEL transmembrane domain-containing protein 2 n=1 Tax=Orycteropus afer afer TaxID=1230840 RepID=A0A8B6ZS98_ORYAF|nr:CKLF-like MARVEL transmembrane domain-containing protein 2 [Orycteropus afer afer]